MLILFVDTNFFLQCRDPAELAWEQATGGQDALVLIPRTVQQEVDRLKQAGNSRRAKRARKASSLFRRIIESPDLKTAAHDAGPRIELSFPPPPDPHRARPAQLDLAQADDRIIEEALAYRATHPNEDVRLLTHDTNPMLTARHCGLPCVAVPDAWLLPPEPDERDKALAEVQRRLDTLERVHPAIAVSATDGEGNPMQRVRHRIDAFKDLAEAEIDGILAELQANHPIADSFEGHGKPMPTRPPLGIAGGLAGFSTRGRYEPPTEAEIEQYRDVDYPAWLRAARTWLEELPEQLEAPVRSFGLSFVLTNDGARPAENVVVEIRAQGGLLIAPPKSRDEDDAEQTDGAPDRAPRLPQPPRPPAARYRGLASSLTDSLLRGYGLDPVFATPHIPPFLPQGRTERDPHAFYWKGGRPVRHQSEWTLTCAEFRHKADPEPFDLVIFVPRTALITKAAVTCRVSASNLPEPVSVTVPVAIAYDEKDTAAEARLLLP
ncbi:PIN domain-containing protein [Azospirillum canadense]|uniref:PIN domain-containing protein n=1 Tax=Azospirillum canadense TaxID=403962 RepID=UPI002226FE02|nr:PIN domain-containing protein [Azospirillum canadense]MCW2236828.1 hypothetical protein [Azospirillum canadense]